MKTKYKLILSGIWILTMVIAFRVGIEYQKFDLVIEPVTETEPIIVNGKTKCYVKKYSWGLAGNHWVAYLTNSQQRTNMNEDEDQLLTSSGTVFFTTKSDTLTIYCRTKPPLNPNFKPNLTVKYIELNNGQFMSLYDKLHEQLKNTDWM
ncbi:MAG: hypothetical protein ACFHWX_05855 [Bacteroidota bacterium]